MNCLLTGLEASPFAIAMKHRKWKLAESILQRLTSCDLVLLELGKYSFPLRRDCLLGVRGMFSR